MQRIRDGGKINFFDFLSIRLVLSIIDKKFHLSIKKIQNCKKAINETLTITHRYTGSSTNVETLTSNKQNCLCIRTEWIKIGGDVCWAIFNEANTRRSETGRVIVLVKRVVINKCENEFYRQRTCAHC